MVNNLDMVETNHMQTRNKCSLLPALFPVQVIANNEKLGLSIITGLDYWNGVMKWTTGLTLFVLKIILILSNKI